MYHIKQYADRCIWIESGQIKLEGSTKKVCDKYLEFMDKVVADNENNEQVSTGIYGTIIKPTEEILSRSFKVLQNQTNVNKYVDKYHYL